MITGCLSREATEALVDVGLLGADGAVHRVQAVIDTGFVGMITLPRDVIAACKLQREGESSGTLADGSQVFLDTYTGDILWDGKVRGVTVFRLDEAPLIGTELLQGHRLEIHFVEDGLVQIEVL